MDEKQIGETAKRFLKACSRRHWKRALRDTQKSWMDMWDASALEKKLRDKISPLDIKSVGEVLSVNKVRGLSNVIRDVEVEVTRRNRRKLVLNVRLVCEEAPYTPSAEGDWGGNPTSCLRVKDAQPLD